MEKIIKIAIEGGLKCPKGFNKEDCGCFDLDSDSESSLRPMEIFSMPLFWSALSKSLGWEKVTCKHDGQCLDGASGIHCSEWESNNCDEYKWQTHWHRFIDHLIANKSVDSFFEELLN